MPVLIAAMEGAMMPIYCFAKPDQMGDHRFTDDVAITYALTKSGAIRKFSHSYSEIRKRDVSRVKYSRLIKRIAILTSY